MKSGRPQSISRRNRTISSKNCNSSLRLENCSSVEHQHGRQKRGEENMITRRQWVLTKRDENQLLVFEKKVLRTIYGPKIENGFYRSRYNHELDKEFNECPKCHEDKQIALRWSHDQKTQRPTTKSSIQSQTHWKEKSRTTDIQVGGWGEQR
jgi:hypothetical protein